MMVAGYGSRRAVIIMMLAAIAAAPRAFAACFPIRVTQSATTAQTNVQTTIILTASSPNGGPYVYRASSLPPGLTLNSSNGVISGKPLTAGTYTIPVTVFDCIGCSDTAEITIVVSDPAACNLTLTSSINLRAGTFCTAQIVATGGIAPYVFAVSGTLFSAGGMDYATPLPGDRVVITGVPAAGTYTVDVDASGPPGCAAHLRIEVVVLPACRVPVVVNGGQNKHLKIGDRVSFAFTASGGIPPYTFTLKGNVPHGVGSQPGLFDQELLLNGTVTASGIYQFQVIATDSIGCTGIADVTIKVDDDCRSPRIRLSAPTAFMEGDDVSIDLTTDPAGDSSFTVSGLPAGLKFDGSKITGKAAPAGVSIATITATPPGKPQCAVTQSVEFNIKSKNTAEGGCTTTLTVPIPPQSAPGVEALIPLDGYAAGGTKPYKFFLGPDAPPGAKIIGPNLDLKSDRSGTYNLTLYAGDFNRCVAAQQIVLLFTGGVTLTKMHTYDAASNTIRYFFIAFNRTSLFLETDVDVNDSVPAGVTNAVPFGDCKAKTAGVTCGTHVALLPGGNEIIGGFSGTATVRDGTTLENTAQVDTDLLESPSSSNVDTFIPDGPDLDVTKTHAAGRTAKPFVWTITVRNRGRKDTDGPVSVEDTLPPGVIADNEALKNNPDADCAVLGSNVRCEIKPSRLPIKAPPAKDEDTIRTIAIPVKSIPDGEVVNTVLVHGGGASGKIVQDTVKADEK